MNTYRQIMDVKALSSTKLGSILRTLQQQQRDEQWLYLKKVRSELILRGEYESEMSRRPPS